MTLTLQQLYEFAMQNQGGPGNDPVARAGSAMKSGGTSMAANSQTMAQGKGGGDAGARVAAMPAQTCAASLRKGRTVVLRLSPVFR